MEASQQQQQQHPASHLHHAGGTGSAAVTRLKVTHDKLLAAKVNLPVTAGASQLHKHGAPPPAHGHVTRVVTSVMSSSASSLSTLASAGGGGSSGGVACVATLTAAAAALGASDGTAAPYENGT